MKKQILLAMFAVCALFVGCTSDETMDPQPTVGYEEGDIVFGVSASIPETRTVYGDVNTEKNLIEVNWDNNDYVMIACPQAAGTQLATYKVTNITGGTDGFDEVSKATGLSKVGGVGLQWGEGAHNFYAVYPAPTEEVTAKGIEITMDDNGLTGLLPMDQTATPEGAQASGYVQAPDMDYAYMVAKTEGVVGPTEVGLTFNSLVTAIQFELVVGDINITQTEDGTTTTIAEEIVLQRISLSSREGTPIAGRFNYKFSPKEDEKQCTTISDDALSPSITMDYTDSPITIDTKKTFDVTFFMLPTVSYPKRETIAEGDDYLQLTVMYTVNGQLMTKTAKIKSAITPQHKHKFTGVTLPSHSGDVSEITGSSWLSAIPDAVLLSQLSIPIAGNAFSYQYDTAGTKTDAQFKEQQTLDYETLWNMGVRGFEFQTSYGFAGSERKNTLAEEYFIVNGVENTNGVTFGTAFETLCANFIGDEPKYKGEFLVLVCTYRPYWDEDEVTESDFNPQYYLEDLEAYLTSYMTSKGLTPENFLAKIDGSSTVGSLRNKVAIIVRPADDEYRGSTTPLVPATYGSYISVVNDWGTAKDCWDKRYGDQFYRAGYYSTTSNNDEKAIFEKYMYAVSPAQTSRNAPTWSTALEGCDFATPTLAPNYYFDINGGGTTTDTTDAVVGAWMQSWERVINTPKGATYSGEYDYYTQGDWWNPTFYYHHLFYNMFSSWADKQKMVKDLFDASMDFLGTTNGPAMVINNLSCGFANSTNVSSYYPWVDGCVYTYTMANGDQGSIDMKVGDAASDGIDWKAGAAVMNKMVYDYLNTTTKEGPYGFVIMDYIGSDLGDVDATNAAKELPNLIMMNNFKFPMSTVLRTPEGEPSGEFEKVETSTSGPVEEA